MNQHGLPFSIHSYTVKWCVPNAALGWVAEMVLLPKQREGESTGDYQERCVSYVRLSHRLPDDAYIILTPDFVPPSIPASCGSIINPVVREIADWLRYGGDNPPTNKETGKKEKADRNGLAWVYAELIERKFG